MSSPQNREAYLQKYATILKCPGDAYSVAAKLIATSGEFNSAACIVLGLSARDDEQANYARKFGQYLKEYVGEGYENIDAEWLAAFVSSYVSEVDPSYKW